MLHLIPNVKSLQTTSGFLKKKEADNADDGATERDQNFSRVGGRIVGFQRDAKDADTDALEFASCQQKKKYMTAFVKEDGNEERKQHRASSFFVWVCDKRQKKKSIRHGCSSLNHGVISTLC